MTTLTTILIHENNEMKRTISFLSTNIERLIQIGEKWVSDIARTRTELRDLAVEYQIGQIDADTLAGKISDIVDRNDKEPVDWRAFVVLRDTFDEKDKKVPRRTSKKSCKPRPSDFCKRCGNRNDDNTCKLLGYDPGDYAVCDKYKDWVSDESR